MNTLLGRLWILGAVLGLAVGVYLFIEREGGPGAILGAVFLGGMVGVLLAMAIGAIRDRTRRVPVDRR